MPQLNGIDTAREIRKFAPKVKIVFLTMHNELVYVQEAFEAGASAYVLKHSASVDLLLAIRRALLGRTYITPGVADNGVNVLLRGSRGIRKPSAQLTSRQRDVLQLVAEGRSAKEAGEILHLSPRTVEFHKYRLMQQLNLRTSAQLTQYAIKHRIISG
jgi:DNA-binding NarL/FixJ family response regulator